jgi:hypothetical protein
MPSVAQLFKNLADAWKKKAWRWAIGIALVSDALGFGVGWWPPFQWAIDAITALALFIALGFRWGLVPALAIEVVPGLQVFPAWTLAVIAMAAVEKEDHGQGS